METLFLHVNDPGAIERVGDILRCGGLAAIPTETVYGLAANALNGKAVAGIFAAKGRPVDNPLIVHICDISQWESLVQYIPENARRLAEAYWPGPLTIILPKADCIPEEVSPGLSTVSVRFPSHPAAQAVIRAAGCPLAAPSANLSGKPSPTTALHVLEDMNGRIDAILDGGSCDVGVESTVITLATPVPRLLRPGGVTLEQLQAVLGEVEVDPAVTHELAAGAEVASPGMKYKHYAPQSDVVIVGGSREKAAAYIRNHFEPGDRVLCFEEEL
ncbi:MAG: threonylcarbamoyl-AMP synthase, partial [Clostridia bacterium]|nr:threonylcarbamoyl-AMP synthase [Clostridia bacterium]